jgi:hypothetical protein
MCIYVRYTFKSSVSKLRVVDYARNTFFKKRFIHMVHFGAGNNLECLLEILMDKDLTATAVEYNVSLIPFPSLLLPPLPSPLSILISNSLP